MSDYFVEPLARIPAYYTMSQSQNSEQNTKPDAPPDETRDTGFSETWPLNTINIAENQAKVSEIPEKGEESETRFRTMTEKGFEFRSAVKEKSARAAFKIFHTSVTAFHAFMGSTKDLDQIKRFSFARRKKQNSN